MLKHFVLSFLGLVIVGNLRAQSVAPGSRYPLTYKNRQLVIGEGGGFTGGSRAYYLLENGYLYVKSDTDSLFTRLGRKSTAATRQLFRQVEQSCRIKTTRFDHPGNRYQFVRWKKGATEYTVTWGDNGSVVPPAYRRFYESFTAQLPAEKPD